MKLRLPRLPRPSRTVLQATTSIACTLALVMTLNTVINRVDNVIDIIGYTMFWTLLEVIVILTVVGIIAGPTDHERSTRDGQETA